MQRRSEARESKAARLDSVRSAPRPSVMTADAVLEDYLDHVCRPLVGLVPYEVRRELRSELRAHLEARRDAYEELGSCTADALREALAQFGDPSAIGQRWLREWRRVRLPAPVTSPWHATLVALAHFGLSGAVCGTIFLLAGQGQALTPFDSRLFGLLLFGIAPFGTGIRTGLAARGRAALGTFFALSFLTMAGGLTYRLLLPPWSEPGILSFLALGIPWIPVGCVGAAIGGWLKNHCRYAFPQWAAP